MKVFTMIFVVALVAAFYWYLEFGYGLAFNGRVGGVYQCILIMVCTAIILKKIDSLKQKDEKEGNEEKEE